MKLNYEPAILWPGLLIGLCALHPLFLFAVFISLYKYREPWIKEINQQFSIYKWWYLAFPVTAFAFGYLNAMPFVPDDLMVHAVAYKFSYDYRSIYVHTTPFLQFSPSIGFQVLAGKLHQFFGPEYAVRIVQIFAVILFYTSFLIALYKALKDHPDKWLWCAIIFALCITQQNFRVFTARPDVFFAAWLISATFLYPFVWVIIGILIMPTYWLAIIYTPGVILLNTTWKKKIVYGAIYALSCLTFWYFYSEGQWLEMPKLITEWGNNRIIGNPNELSSIWPAFGSPYFLGLLILLCYFLYKASLKLTPRSVFICLIIAYFLLPNYFRYTIIIISFTGILCALQITRETKINPRYSALILLLSSLIAYKATASFPYKKLPSFKLPENAILLTQYNVAIGSAILHNPNAKFAPAIEIGANHKDVQNLIMHLDEGKNLDCKKLKEFSFTHVLESTLPEKPACLNLVEINGKWRLWKVNHNNVSLNNWNKL